MFSTVLLLPLFLPSLSALLTDRQKAGQLLQLSVSNLLSPSLEVDPAKLSYYITELHIGSFLDSPTSSSELPLSSFPQQRYADLSPAALAPYVPENTLPPILGIDSIHGACYLSNSSIYPQPVSQAATFDPLSSSSASLAAAAETAALTTNAYRWVFSPLLGVAGSPLWARSWETYGASPLLAERFSAAAVAAVEAAGLASSAKHYRGYPGSRTGGDRVYPPGSSLADLSVWSSLLSSPSPPSTVMTSYTSINGRVPTTSDAAALSSELRGRLNYSGVVVTDFAEVTNLGGWHRASPDLCDAVLSTLSLSGVDMLMSPFDPEPVIDCIASLLSSGLLPRPTVDAKLARISALKVGIPTLTHNPNHTCLKR